jgi:hypothetical protein
MTFVTPGTFSKSDSAHQKQPAARVAILSDVTAFVFVTFDITSFCAALTL